MRSFNVGDKVRIKYKEQEGYVIDIDGDLYKVSTKDGAYVDSFYAKDLELLQGVVITPSKNYKSNYREDEESSSSDTMSKVEALHALTSLLLGVLCLLALPVILIFFFVMGIAKSSKD
jgi:hypothetical protein